MPRFWFDYHSNKLPDGASEEDIARRDFNMSILADRKPYFMCYIYPALMKQYRTYMKNVETKCARKFRIGLADLMEIPENQLTDEQREFIQYYRHRLPVGNGNCVMNRICRRFEEEFDGKMKAWCEEPFDYTIMKNGSEYPRRRYEMISDVYAAHNRWMREFSKLSKEQRVDADEAGGEFGKSWFKRQCFEICSNGYELCDIVLDMCYRRIGTKEFAWDISSNYIISNLAGRHGGKISFPTLDPEGDIEFGGDRFSMTTVDWIYTDTEEDLFDGDRTEREGMGDEGD